MELLITLNIVVLIIVLVNQANLAKTAKELSSQLQGLQNQNRSLLPQSAEYLFAHHQVSPMVVEAISNHLSQGEWDKAEKLLKEKTDFSKMDIETILGKIKTD